MRWNKGWILILLASMLASCSMFSPVKTVNATSFVIIDTPPPQIKHVARKQSILVLPILANNIYNTTGMAYSTQPYTIAYFVKNQWADPPTQMLQPLVVQTLEGTQYFSSVGAAPTIGQYDILLNLRLLELQQVFTSAHTSVVQLRIRGQLINATTNEVIAVRDFNITQPTPQNTPAGGVVATNQAVVDFLLQLQRWCLANLSS